MPLSTFATLRDVDRAARAEALPAAQRRAHPGRDPAGRLARQALRFSKTRRQDPAARLHHRLRRRIAPAAHRRQQVPRHVPALGDPDLPRARGAVRELPRSVHHPRRLRAARALRRAALLLPRLHDAQHLQPGRTDHAGRARRRSNGILIVEFANHLQETGKDKLAPSSKPPAPGCGRS